MTAACVLAWSAHAQPAAVPEMPPQAAPSRPQPSAEQIEKRRIILGCGTEGRLALRIASAYFGPHGRSKQAALADAALAGEPGKAMARDLLDQAGAGLIAGAPRFATQRVIKCLDAANFPMDREVTVEMSDLCWARSDAIAQSEALKLAGKTREQAEAALRERFTNPVAFPPSYLKSINTLVYERIDNPEQADEGQNTFYWSCLVAAVREASRK